MKVYTQYMPARMGYAVYVELSEEQNGTRWYATQYNSDYHGAGQPVQVPLGTEAPIYMFVPDPIAEALGEALAPRLPATEWHLTDAIGVRDRLLTLVEKVVKEG